MVIYFDAAILGGDTMFGKDNIIGGNFWLIESISPCLLVYQKFDTSSRSQNDDFGSIDFHIWSAASKEEKR